MMLNPFLIGTQRDGEDQATYALACTLQEVGGVGLGALLNDLGGPVDLPSEAAVVAEVQPSAISTRPDARLSVPDRLTVLLESKVVHESLRREQVVGHLDLFGSLAATVTRVMLAITPDPHPPDWWDDVAAEHAAIRWVHGSWQDVYEWARESATDDAPYDPCGQMLLQSLAGLLRHEGLGRDIERRQDPERVHRIERGVAAWFGDLKDQHDVQETLLEAVARAFLKPLDDAPGYTVASRWRDPKSWNPVSTYLQIDWQRCPLPGWPTQKLWVEVFLERALNPHRIRIRSGVLLEGSATVQRWHGRLLDVSGTAFGDRHGKWRWRSRYAEAWAYRDYRADDVEGMVGEVVDDLAVWVDEVLPQLRPRPEEEV